MDPDQSPDSTVASDSNGPKMKERDLVGEQIMKEIGDEIQRQRKAKRQKKAPKLIIRAGPSSSGAQSYSSSSAEVYSLKKMESLVNEIDQDAASPRDEKSFIFESIFESGVDTKEEETSKCRIPSGDGIKIQIRRSRPKSPLQRPSSPLEFDSDNTNFISTIKKEESIEEESNEDLESKVPSGTTSTSNSSDILEVSSKMTNMVNLVKIKERGRPRKVPKPVVEEGERGEEGKTQGEDEEGGRTKRKRKPPKHFVPEIVPRLKIRRRKEGEVEGPDTSSFFETVDERTRAIIDMVSSSSEVVGPSSPSSRGRGRGRGKVPSGRGRGRPRGSTLKAKLERAAAEFLAATGQPRSETGEMPEEISSLVDVALSQLRKKRGGGRGSRGGGLGRGSGKGSRGGKRIQKLKEKKKIKKTVKKVQQPPQVFEEETRMSADIKIKPAIDPVIQDEESRTSLSSASGKIKKFTKDVVEDRPPVTAENLFEYRWPPNERNAELYMLQEQVSEYLGVKSFKRKYPDLRRRIVDMEERDFLREKKIVSETQCDLGLTSLCSSDVLDVMFNDFPEKYEEFNKFVMERREREFVKAKASLPPPPPRERDRGAEFMRRITKSASKWNSNLNRERREERSCSFDLQTSTLNVQSGKMRVLGAEMTKVGHYPVALLPGQYCDHFKRYTPTELKYLPLNTVSYGPLLPQDYDHVDESEASSDSDDSESSSDSSSTSSSSDEDEIDIPNGHQLHNGVMCRTCEGDSRKNRDGNPEILLHCTKCDTPNHPTCLELSIDMLPFIKKYNWQCTDCKNCIECNDPADEDKMLFCDLCDRGYHIYCVGLRKVPIGRWHCRVCSLCYSCGTTKPSDEDRTAEWHHEGEKGARYYLHSHCVSCHKIYKKGLFCPMCLKVHLKVDDKKNIECRSCERWVHRECVKRPIQTMFGFMCDPCDAAFRTKTKLPTHN